MNSPWEKVRRIWEIIDSLRGEPGCPWDRKQTPETVQTYLMEEAHEAASAIRSGQVQEAAEELGDLLFMVFLIIHIYEEHSEFQLKDVAELVCEKMIRRHPHVFGDISVSSAEEVKDNWEKIKAKEKASNGKPPGEIPESLPALMRAYRILSRMSDPEGAFWNDTEARAQEFARESEQLARDLSRDVPVQPETFGKLLLDLVNLARIKGYRSEDCLHKELRSMKNKTWRASRNVI
ncbi:MAG: MazG family protein [Syntrophobacteraceae bacterium]